MPKTSQEQYQELIDATAEAKKTIRELHEARAAAMDVLKKQKREIADKIQDEVKLQVGELSEYARTQLENSVAKVIDDITDDWRRKLGIDQN